MDFFKELSSLPGDDILPTFSENIDLHLGGGFSSGCVTEIVGEAGTGKTQLCLQLCANAQLPRSIGGLDARCIFFDCNGGFDSRRFTQICKPTQELAQKIIVQQKLGCSQLKSFTDGVLYRRVDSVEHLLSSLDDLVSEVMPACPDVRLLIVDSIAFHFRYPIFEGAPNATSTLHQVMQKISAISNRWNLVTIVTNQVTTRVSKLPGEICNDGQMIPALGESWLHSPSTSVTLSFPKIPPSTSAENLIATTELETVKSLSREIRLTKSSRHQCGNAPAIFCITSDGIREKHILRE